MGYGQSYVRATMYKLDVPQEPLYVRILILNSAWPRASMCSRSFYERSTTSIDENEQPHL